VHGYGYNLGSGWGPIVFPRSVLRKGDGLTLPDPEDYSLQIGVTLPEVREPSPLLLFGDTNDDPNLPLWRRRDAGVRADEPEAAPVDTQGHPYEPPRHAGGQQLRLRGRPRALSALPGGTFSDGGPLGYPRYEEPCTAFFAPGQWVELKWAVESWSVVSESVVSGQWSVRASSDH